MTVALGFPGPFELVLLATLALPIVIMLVVTFMVRRGRRVSRGFPVVEEKKDQT